MKSRQLPIILTLLLASFFCQGGEPIVIGETISIYSKTLMKQATLNIRLPNSYQGLKDKRYPVLISVGDDNSFTGVAGTVHWLSHNKEYPMPEVILVSFTTETAISFIGRGVKNEDFINFFGSDVIPYIDKQYRTQPFRILAASERFGAVPLYGLTHKTELFQAYIAMSPWIEPKSELITQFEVFLKSHKPLSAFLWLSSGGEPHVAPVYNKLVALLQKNKPGGLEWKSSLFNQNTNMSQPLLSLPNALESLFADLTLDPTSGVVAGGAVSIKRYYQQLSENKYGYPVSAESAINEFGHDMLRQKKINKAIEVFQMNVKEYPDSPHVYASLAIGFMADNNFDAALPVQNAAYELAKKQDSAYKDFYRQQLTEIESELSAKQRVRPSR